MMTEFNLEQLAQSMHELADLISRARILSIETHSQVQAFDRFMHHHSELVKAAKVNDADAFILNLEPAYHAGRIIILGLKDDQIQLILGGA